MRGRSIVLGIVATAALALATEPAAAAGGATVRLAGTFAVEPSVPVVAQPAPVWFPPPVVVVSPLPPPMIVVRPAPVVVVHQGPPYGLAWGHWKHHRKHAKHHRHHSW